MTGMITEKKETVPIQTYIDCANTYKDSETKNKHESILNNTHWCFTTGVHS